MNMLTEEEARTKWCPMVRHAIQHDSPSAPNRSGSGDDGGVCSDEISKWNKCVASDCMMWRFVSPTELGYCGLAAR